MLLLLPLLLWWGGAAARVEVIKRIGAEAIAIAIGLARGCVPAEEIVAEKVRGRGGLGGRGGDHGATARLWSRERGVRIGLECGVGEVMGLVRKSGGRMGQLSKNGLSSMRWVRDRDVPVPS